MAIKMSEGLCILEASVFVSCVAFICLTSDGILLAWFNQDGILSSFVQQIRIFKDRHIPEITQPLLQLLLLLSTCLKEQSSHETRGGLNDYSKLIKIFVCVDEFLIISLSNISDVLLFFWIILNWIFYGFADTLNTVTD